MSIDVFVELYEAGLITKYEFFILAQNQRLEMIEDYREEYEEWIKDHPPDGDCRTARVVA